MRRTNVRDLVLCGPYRASLQTSLVSVWLCAVAVKRYISMRVAKSLVRLRWETRGYLHFLSAQPTTAWGPAIIRPLRFFWNHV